MNSNFQTLSLRAASLLVAAIPAQAGTVTRSVDQEVPVQPTQPSPPFTGGTPLDIDENGVDDFLFFNFTDGTLGAAYMEGTSPNNTVFGLTLKSDPTTGFGLPAITGSFAWGPDSLPKSDAFGPLSTAAIGFADQNQGGLFLTSKSDAPGLYYPFLLQFDIDQDRHYGFARVQAALRNPGELSVRIGEVGYATDYHIAIHIPNPVPEPGTLGMLAIGAAALACFRRKS